MELDYFLTFREIARRQSFTRAAEQLGYAQSSVTAQMQKLEREYGVPLFERYGRKLRLTPPGETLLKLAGQMLDLYDQSKEALAVNMSGSLTIGTIDSLAAYYLPPYLQQLRRQFPALGIQLATESESALLAKVRDGDFDIGLSLDLAPADPQLSCISVREEPLVLIAAPGHPLTRCAAASQPQAAVPVQSSQSHPDAVSLAAVENETRTAPFASQTHEHEHHQPQATGSADQAAIPQQTNAPSITLDQLHGSELIVTEHSCIYRSLFEKLLKDHNVPHRIVFELASLEAIKQCVRSSLGIALLPAISVQTELAQGHLAAIPFAHPSLHLHLQVIVHPKKWMSRPLNSLIDMLKTT